MLLTLSCPSCRVDLEVDVELAGGRIECPQCHASLTVPPRSIGPGVILGGFRIVSLLGRGGMGEVYVARQLSLEREVALKILPAAMNREPGDTERFLQEVRVLARLEHPHIVPAYEAGDDGGVLYLAMGYVKGESLEGRLRRAGAMGEGEALRLGRKLAGALAFAWNEHRLLHRDVKPANVLIDEHGEPKLGDFGLAKSAGGSVQLTIGSVMLGTPNYMSPEQAEGAKELDFRADIYSLGATLYHALTGQAPFAGTSVMEVLRKQAVERLADPRHWAPEVTGPCVALLEHMLTRRPQQRPGSWEEWIEEAGRVLAGHYPRARALAPGDSVLEREDGEGPRRRTGKLQVDLRALGEKRHEVEAVARRAESAQQARRLKWALGAAAAAAVALGVGALVWRVVAGMGAKERARAAAPSAVVLDAAKAAADAEAAKRAAALTALKTRYEEAAAFAAEHPEQYAEALSRFGALKKAAAGTEYEGKAAGEIERLEGLKRAAVAAALAVVKREAEGLAGAGKWAEAAARARGYAGPLAADTAGEREALAKEMEEREVAARGEAAKREQAARAKLAEVTRAVAADLLDGKDGEALKRLRAAEKEEALALVAAEWGALKAMTQRVAGGVERAVLESFAADAGKEPMVYLGRGCETLHIVGVEAGTIKAERRTRVGGGYAAAPRNFRYADVAAREKLARLGTGEEPERQILRALALWEQKSAAAAQEALAKADCPLGRALAERAGEMLGAAEAEALAQQNQAAEQAAENDYAALLGAACPDLAAKVGASAASNDMAQVTEAIGRKRYTETQVKAIGKQVEAFCAAHAETECARARETVIQLLHRIIPGVAAVVDAETLEKARKAIEKANPGGEIIWMAQYVDDRLTVDVSRNAHLRTIAPLAGLPIRELNLSRTAVSDLSPLRGLPLRSLNLNGCTNVSDLTPLAGAALVSLDVGGCTKVADLQPLKGMPLTSLEIYYCGGTYDLRPIQNMRLSCLHVRSGSLTDIGPLKGMPLKELWLETPRVADLRPLAGMPLEVLKVAGCGGCNPIRNLEGIHGLPLNKLYLYGCTSLTDLRPLRELLLAELSLEGCAVVKDLSPLQGMPLSVLSLKDCASVADIRALKGMRLTHLSLEGTQVKDLTPLKGMSTLKYLRGADGQYPKVPE